MPTCQNTNCTNPAWSFDSYKTCKECKTAATPATAATPGVKIHKIATFGKGEGRDYAYCGHNTRAWNNTHHNLTDDNNEVTCTRCINKINRN